MYLEQKDALIQDIIKATFPDYHGRKVQLSFNPPKRLNSYWSGGSKTSYAFYHLDTKKAYAVETNHPFFEAGKPRNLEDGLPPRLLLVAHVIFCGKDMGITICANTKDLAPILPEKIELTNNECTVLKYTKEYKNSYAGKTNIRWQRAHDKTKISQQAWQEVQANLKSRKLLAANGAITAKGRNALAQEKEHLFFDS